MKDNNYKQTEIPKNWQKVKLEEITLSVNRGFQPSYTETEGVKVINQKCIRDWKVDTTESKLNDLNKKFVPEDKYLISFDILINSTGTGTVGRVGQVVEPKEPLVFDSHVTLIRPDFTKVDGRYLGYKLFLLEKYFEKLAEGSTNQVELPRGKIRNLEILIPSGIETQEKIASVLSTLDDKIEVNNKIARALEEMVQAIFKEWFVNFRFPGHEKIEFVDSDMGKIPKGWENGDLSVLVTLGRTAINPHQFQFEQFTHYSLPAFDNNQEHLVEFGKEIMSNKFLLPNSCTLVSKLNPRIPRLWLINDDKDGLRKISSTEFLVMIPREKFNLNFLHTFFQSSYFQNIFQSRTTGTSTSHQRVKPNDLLNIPMVIPPQNILLAFNQIVFRNWELIETLKKENQKLATLRDLLLPKLMKGEITV